MPLFLIRQFHTVHKNTRKSAFHLNQNIFGDLKDSFLHFDAVFGKARVLLLQEEKPYVIALYVVVYKY